MARRKNSIMVGDGASYPTPSTSRAIPPGSLADYVFETLRREILEGALLPGSSILQDKVADRLGVSITPVREALRKLESTGLVSYETNYGATVSELSDQAVLELYMLRSELEGLTALLAARLITDEQLDGLRIQHEQMGQLLGSHEPQLLSEASFRFHMRIAEIGGPAFLAGHLKWLRQKFPVAADESVWRFEDIASEAYRYHGLILDALALHDGEEAKRLMAIHIESAPARLRREAANQA